MFSGFSTAQKAAQLKKSKFVFIPRGDNHPCTIDLVQDPTHINQELAACVLVESFVGEYEKHLQPQDVNEQLTSWRGEKNSGEEYYREYFKSEFEEFVHKKVHYWVEAKIEGILVGWATFMREENEPNAVYMNLLAVHPDYQRKGIGEQLVKSLLQFGVIDNLDTVHLLLRKTNKGGAQFYIDKLGFKSDPDYTRTDNFVPMDQLTGLTWKTSFSPRLGRK